MGGALGDAEYREENVIREEEDGSNESNPKYCPEKNEEIMEGEAKVLTT